eukprot:COSAG02_NODE_10607_length_1901_cov_1.623751_3_plen_53_part_00
MDGQQTVSLAVIRKTEVAVPVGGLSLHATEKAACLVRDSRLSTADRATGGTM